MSPLQCDDSQSIMLKFNIAFLDLEHCYIDDILVQAIVLFSDGSCQFKFKVFGPNWVSSSDWLIPFVGLIFAILQNILYDNSKLAISQYLLLYMQVPICNFDKGKRCSLESLMEDIEKV